MISLIVAAAVIEEDGRFLVTRRPPGVHLAGSWEFPGGKCEPGEAVTACLVREIREELAADVTVGAEILQTSHRYDDRHVELHFLRCELRSCPAAALGQEIRWVRRDELTTLAFPAADAELIELLMANDG
jgi:mutator protein MutT